MPTRTNISTEAKWEDIVGYSRAVRIGDVVEVTGTVALKNGEPYAPGDPYEQTKRAIEIIQESLRKVGATLKDVTRTRIFVTDIEFWEPVGRAHGEYFGDIRPATTMVEVSALIQPEFLVEIEASAYLHSED